MTNILDKITQNFKTAGYQLYEVGGSVRDTILGRPINDIDLCTEATPTESLKLCSEFSAYAVGEKFGTIGIATPEGNIEITTFRDEVYPNNSRKPEVVFGKDLIKDLSRRDFTVNAICIDLIKLSEYYEDLDGIRINENKK